ncbi:histone H3.v1-like [Strongylocentrotus purpuratus]|uniref:Uncharacterized protein n=1 Tax=Strongylocentrotus purpuratus TaxID=7668 RepID=A0A7M7PN48_STRPU|nr:histone H3.v1-like [Strongylocentrotus purpuratus]
MMYRTVSLYWSSPICFHYSANRVVPRFQHELAETLAFNEYVYLNDIQTNQINEFVQDLQEIHEGTELTTDREEIIQEKAEEDELKAEEDEEKAEEVKTEEELEEEEEMKAEEELEAEEEEEVKAEEEEMKAEEELKAEEDEEKRRRR